MVDLHHQDPQLRFVLMIARGRNTLIRLKNPHRDQDRETTTGVVMIPVYQRLLRVLTMN
jgi:hypothetical protein